MHHSSKHLLHQYPSRIYEYKLSHDRSNVSSVIIAAVLVLVVLEEPRPHQLFLGDNNDCLVMEQHKKSQQNTKTHTAPSASLPGDYYYYYYYYCWATQ